MPRLVLFFCMILTTLGCIAQDGNKISLRGQVTNEKNNSPLEFATIFIADQTTHYSAMSGENGQFVIPGIKKGRYKLTVSFVGYNKYEEIISFSADTTIIIRLTSSLTPLDEFVVTASESRSMTSSTIINRTAMEHLQPSSFADLLELLPGGKAKDPVLTSSNLARIREVGRSSSKYDISTLGSSFLIDGIPLSTTANMQYTTGSEILLNNGYVDDSRSTVNRGVDMRSISTDQIERVEIIRGLASVRYGNLTSGLIKIERKRGINPLEARLKVDALSKLFAIGKGFEISKNTILNIGVDYLDAKADPTNRIENYQRINTSVRFSSKWDKKLYMLRWDKNFDFGHTLDKEKTDPETGYDKIDLYRSAYNRFGLNNNLKWTFKRASFINTLELLTSVSYEIDKIKQTRFVQVTSPTAIPNTTEPGVSDGIYLPPNWTSHLTVDGRPLSIYSQLNGTFSVKILSVVHNLQSGAEWKYDKNFGDGQVYDVTRPPSPYMSTRPRAYSDIPALQTLALYVEDDVNIPIYGNQLRLNAGIRASSMLGINPKYRMSKKYYFDPRSNIEWSFPSIEIRNKSLKISVGGGLGWQSVNPTLDYLYPDWIYNDIVQLNYYHNNPDYRRINIKTYKNKFINYDLEPSRNRKWEIKLNMSYDNNYFSITYFREKMKNGFRNETTTFQLQDYKIYNPNSINSSELTAPPDLDQMTFVSDTIISLYGQATNGSVIQKEGVEFSFSSKRFEALKTRITMNGAWFRSYYDNSTLVFKSAQRAINGGYIKEKGIYKSDGSGMTMEVLNTNLMFDTYITIIDFIFSTSFQSTWFSKQKSKIYDGMPIGYIDKKGNIHPYTEAERNDTYLGTLYIPVNPDKFTKKKIPFAMDVNFKMSKNFKDKVKVSVFVNRLFDYRPDYTVNGHTYHRNVTPYFGAELNFKF